MKKVFKHIFIFGFCLFIIYLFLNEHSYQICFWFLITQKQKLKTKKIGLSNDTKLDYYCQHD